MAEGVRWEKKEKRDGNTEFTEIGTQRAQREEREGITPRPGPRDPRGGAGLMPDAEFTEKSGEKQIHPLCAG
jgi:hypothetical protein